MKNLFKHFTPKEALQNIKETLENGYDGYLCDLHNEVFNMDYYIVSTHRAKQALEEYGVFNAIEEVVEYETANFGEVLTVLYHPRKLANMLWYIKGEEALHSIQEESELFGELWDKKLDKDDTKELVKIIGELINA